MATPLNVSASQVAQQKLQDPAEAQKLTSKANNKFDAKMADRAQQAQSTNQAGEVQRAQASERATQLQKVEEVSKAQKADLKKVTASTRADSVRDQTPAENVEGKSSHPGKLSDMMPKVEHYLEGLNHSTHKIDDMIKKLSDGKMKLDQKELLKMQIQVYGYSMELDLTGKVVDKATSGLKDTLKTQV